MFALKKLLNSLDSMGLIQLGFELSVINIVVY